MPERRWRLSSLERKLRLSDTAAADVSGDPASRTRGITSGEGRGGRERGYWRWRVVVVVVEEEKEEETGGESGEVMVKEEEEANRDRE